MNLEQLIKDHITEDSTNFGKISDNFGKVSDELRIIRENHLAHMEKDLSVMRTDLDWMKKFFWIVATAILGAVIVLIIK